MSEQAMPADLYQSSHESSGQDRLVSADRPSVELVAVESLQPPLPTLSGPELVTQSAVSGLHEDHVISPCPSPIRSESTTQDPAKKSRTVVPLYGIDARLSKEQLNQLLAVAGDHAVPEDEWVRACHLLGDYRHDLNARRRRSALLPASIALLLLIGSGIVCYVQMNKPQVVPVVGAAVPPAIAPPAARADVDFGPYMANLQRRIKRAWNPPHGSESRQVVVTFNVDKEGALSKLRLKDTSGSSLADAAALGAVENAAPFARLPEGSGGDVDIQFTFSYNIFHSDHAGYSGSNSRMDDSFVSRGSTSNGDGRLSNEDAFSVAGASSPSESSQSAKGRR